LVMPLCRQAIVALTAIKLILADPEPQRLITDTELAGDLAHRAAADLDQTDSLTPKLRRIGPLIPLWHNAPPSSPGAMLTKRSDVRRNGGTSAASRRSAATGCSSSITRTRNSGSS